MINASDRAAGTTRRYMAATQIVQNAKCKMENGKWKMENGTETNVYTLLYCYT